MNEHALKMLKVESDYLSGVEANLEAAKGKQLAGSFWKTSRFDESDRLRALMAHHRVYDRERLKSLPHNRRVVLQGYRRRWLFGKRRTGVAIASVLCPLESLVVDGGRGVKPVDLADLQDHVRRLVVDGEVEHVIGVCAPSGFTASARQARAEWPNVVLVLVEPVLGGGWKVSSSGEALPESVLSMFDPERDSEKVERVRRAVRERSADLLTGGLSASSMAERLGLPLETVTAAIAQEAAADPELRATRKSGEVFLYRGAATAAVEKTSMNVVDRIRKLFSSEGAEAEKINLLSERRAQLALRRDRLYEDIGKLEAKEAELLKQGRENKSQVVRRRVAAQLGQLRKDIGRQNTTTNMLNQQINIISTDIHNLTLIQQGNLAQLPSTEALTENAVQAEEMLESLKMDADMVSSLETGLSEVSTSDEELAILKEFDEVASEPEVGGVERGEGTEGVSESPAVESEESERGASSRKTTDPEAL